MAVSPLDSSLYASLFADAAVAACFSDEAGIQSLLDVEAALARAQARLGLIPAAAAERIAECAVAQRVDPAALRAGLERDGVPVPALVAELRRLAGGEAASHVHWGATTQDIADSALVLQLRAALALLAPGLDAVIDALGDLAERHRDSVMAARTHSQQAVPTTFGLKVCGWLAPLDRHRERLGELKPRLLCVQFGGAAGTLAALGDRGLEVMEALAEELELGPSLMPWHVQRDTLCEFAGWLALLSGSLAKMAQDVILLAQSEIGEVAERPAGEGGGSSTMPQKQNPVASELIVACARTNAALLSAMHQAMIQEQERGTHGWQVEWLTLPQMVALTSGALKHAGALARHLVVDVRRMRDNLERLNGLILSEAAVFALAGAMPRAEAHAHVVEAGRIAAAEDRHLVEVLRERLEATLPEGAVDWARLADPAQYLGESQRLMDRVLARVRAPRQPGTAAGA